jgi:hypothetical protein
MQKRKLIPCILASLAMLLGAIAAGATTLTDAPSFTANEIYELMATDPVEGAALGASFGGIGLDNQPHQQLANRTSFLNNNRIVDEANIAVLQAFDALFVGTMASSGYLKIPVADTAKGQIQYVLQWGSFFPSGGDANDTSYTISWPVPFPHACVWAAPVLSNSQGLMNTGKLLMETQSFTASSGIFRSDLIGGAASAQTPNDGFYWIAIGY